MRSRFVAVLQDVVCFALRHPLFFCRWACQRLAALLLYPDPSRNPAWRAFRASLPPLLHPTFDALWREDRRGCLGIPLSPKKLRSLRTDVLYLGTFKADAEKDLVALKQYRPHLHITGILFAPLLAPLWPTLSPSKFFVFRRCNRVLFFTRHAELFQFLLSCEARVLMVQGGDDRAALLTACLWPGRLVWQVRDTLLRTPRTLLQEEVFERAKEIAERADAIISFQDTAGWELLGRSIHFRCRPTFLPPLCVPALGPRRMKPKLSQRDGELHLVYAGGVGPRGGSPAYRSVYTHADFYEKFRTIVGQGIHLHVYSPHTEFYHPKYHDYFALRESSTYFHLERTVPFAQLLVEFTQYDWAIMHVTWQSELLLPGFDRPIQNGLTGPIQSRIPIIVSPTAYGNAELIRRTRRGLVVAEEDLPRLRQILEAHTSLIRECEERELEPELLYDVQRFGRTVLAS